LMPAKSGPSEDLKRFKAVFEPLGATTEAGEKLRKEKFRAAGSFLFVLGVFVGI